MGASSSKRTPVAPVASASSSQSSSGCPAMPAATDGNTSACPVIGADGTAPTPIFNVYAQQINSADAQRNAAAESAGGSALFPGARRPS
jgi:hypothetical protein